MCLGRTTGVEIVAVGTRARVMRADRATRLLRSRRPVLAAASFAVLAVGLLLLVKWLPYGEKAVSVAGTGDWPGSSLLDTGSPSLRAGWEFLLAYTEAIWPALVAAIVLGAAVEALVPAERLGRLGPLGGGTLALPGMMCTCCAAPLVTSLRRAGAATGSAVAFWLANPVLNPAVLVFLALVGPWQWPVTRLVIGAALVFGAGALAARMAPAEVAPVARPDPRSAPRRFGTGFTRFTLLLVPLYLLLVFAVGALRGSLFPLADGLAAHVVPAVLAAAVLGVLLVLPTGGEIPVVLALVAAGFPPAVIGVLLITLPAVSLPSMVLVGRALTWRVTATAGACTALAGIAAGGLLTVLSG
ncbi:hypothetical protein ACFS2C_04015 [Prauserella oleivorans]|uniref:Permease n=1 Tax=Prauserella oleivorans TaxID=1478153 RepID=A0ABW5W5V5_9PSEU